MSHDAGGNRTQAGARRRHPGARHDVHRRGRERPHHHRHGHRYRRRASGAGRRLSPRRQGRLDRAGAAGSVPGRAGRRIPARPRQGGDRRVRRLDRSLHAIPGRIEGVRRGDGERPGALFPRRRHRGRRDRPPDGRGRPRRHVRAGRCLRRVDRGEVRRQGMPDRQRAGHRRDLHPRKAAGFRPGQGNRTRRLFRAGHGDDLSRDGVGEGLGRHLPTCSTSTTPSLPNR